MFHSISEHLSLKQNAISNETVLQFSLAEYSSAIEMLQASKLVKKSSLRVGFIKHSLDEYRHLNFFTTVLNSRKSKVKFAPILAISNGYINSEKFIYESLSILKFAAFVAVNEQFAYYLFNSLKGKIIEPGSPLMIELVQIIEDEKLHLRQVKSEEYYELLIGDEKIHSGTAFRYLFKHSTRLYANFELTKFTIQNRLRHFFGKENFFKKNLDKIIVSIVLFTLTLLSRSLFFEIGIGKFSKDDRCLKSMI